MNVTIIPSDGIVIVDGRVFGEIDLSFLPADVHAIHWRGEVWEVEVKDSSGRIIENRVITDFAAYQSALDAWEEKRQIADAPPPPPPPPPEPAIPDRVTMRQTRLALHAAGLLHLVDAAIDKLEEPHKTAARIEWEYSQEVHRDKQLVGLLAPVLGLSESDLDDLFTAAAQL